MRDIQLAIVPFSYTALLDLRIDQEINQHVSASIKMRIKDELQEQYQGLLLEECWVKIEAVNETEEREILFQGIVADFFFNNRHHETILELKLLSGTSLMDLDKHFRTFQDSSMSREEIHQTATEEYADARFILPEEMNAAIGRLWIQYRESDWGFLKRLASDYNSFLTAGAVYKGIRFYVGLPVGDAISLEENRICLKLDAGEYRRKIKNGLQGISPSDETVLMFESREYHSIGDFTEYQGRHYFIYKIASEYEDAQCIHKYELKTKAGLKLLPYGNHQLPGVSFDGTVTAVERDKVKLDLLRDENGHSAARKWFVYSTVYSSPDGTGWYCMPEIGDQVRLRVPEQEQDSFVISSVHMESQSGRQNPDHKSMKNRYGKEILFTPDSLTMTNNKGLKIELSDEAGIFIESDKKIQITAEDDIKLVSQGASLMIAAQDAVQVTQGAVSMTLNEDIAFTGGEFRIQ